MCNSDGGFIHVLIVMVVGTCVNNDGGLIPVLILMVV